MLKKSYSNNANNLLIKRNQSNSMRSPIENLRKKSETETKDMGNKEMQ